MGNIVSLNDTTFNPNGKATAISFFDPDDSSGKYPYYFNEKEYDNLTKEYIKLALNPAFLEWHNYE